MQSDMVERQQLLADHELLDHPSLPGQLKATYGTPKPPSKSLQDVSTSSKPPLFLVLHAVVAEDK